MQFRASTFRRLALMLWMPSLVAWASGAVTVTTPEYAAPGYVIAGDAARNFIKARAQFSFTSPVAGNRTLRATFQLLDDSAFPAPVGIYLDGGTVKSNDSVAVSVTQAFVQGKPTDVTIDADIVPYDRLDPSRVYKFKVLEVWDTTDLIDTDLGEAGAQAAGNSYIHFADVSAASLRVSAVMQSGAYSQVFRVSPAAVGAPESSFKITPGVKLYRYDPGAANATVNLRLSVVLRDDLGNDVPLEVATFDDSVANMPATFGGASPYVTAALPLDDIEIRPTGQLDAVNRTYTATVTVAFMDVPLSGTYISVLNGAATTAETLLDFNGELRFNTIRTLFTDLTGAPVAGGITGTRRAATLTLAAGNGRIVGQGDAYTFGGGPLNVAVATNGIAYLLAGSPTLNVSGPATDTGSANGVSFQRGNLQLGTAGLQSATISVTLPPGVGYTTGANTMRFGSTLGTTNVGLSQTLAPTNVVSLPGGRLTEESKPIEYTVSSVSWATNGTLSATVTGVTPVRLAEVTALEADKAKLINPSAATKAANDHLYLGVNSVSGGALTIGRDGDDNGTLTAVLGLGAYKFHPHLPYSDPTDTDQDINYSGGTIAIAADKILPGQSSITALGTIDVSYNRACSLDSTDPGGGCDAQPDTTFVQFFPYGALRVTRDGGLQRDGLALENDPATGLGVMHLKWGQNPSDATKYAHTIGTTFNIASYLMAGSSLVGGVAATGSTAPEAPVGAWLGVGAILYSGVDQATVAEDNVIRPGTAAYAETDANIADYGGINFRAVNFANPQATSVVAGSSTTYNLETRSQYYVRNSGVSGVHEAEDAKRALRLYRSASNPADYPGYPAIFDTFRLAFLDNDNRGSRTDGSLSLPEPSGFTVAFSEFTLTCPGGVKGMEVDSAKPLKLKYWRGEGESSTEGAPITPLSLRFDTDTGCDPAADAVLVMNVRAECELFPQKLDGELGFRGSGQIAASGDGLNPDFESRLKMPTVNMPGPGSKTYPFTPCQDAYFNAADAPGAPATGFISLAGTVDVPFFQDLKWHVQTGARYKTNGIVNLYEVAGGWSANNKTLFNNGLFDPENKGFGGASAAAYRDSSHGGSTYAVTAQQDWLGITNAFHYNLQWNPGGRAFSSEDVTKDFFVVSLSHRAKYLCPDTAELTFGLKYDGLPQINLAGLASSAADAAVGYTQNLIDAMGEESAGTLFEGLDGGKSLLTSDPEDLLAPVVDDSLMAATTTLLNTLYGPDGTPAAAKPNADVATAINTFEGGLGSRIGNAFKGRDKGTAAYLAADRLGSLQAGIEQVAGGGGLLQTSGVKRLVSSLVAREAPQFVSLVAGELAGESLDDVVNAPALGQIRENLAKVSDIITEARGKMTDAQTGLGAQLQDLADADSETVAAAVATAVEAKLAGIQSATETDLPELPRAELRDFIRRQIIDELAASQTVSAYQTQVRQYSQDVVSAATTQIDSGIQQVNNALRDVIAARLAEVDQSINQRLLGPMGDMLGAGRMSGYAHIDNDSLSMLRVDGKFQFKVPDDLELKAYLQIKRMTSDNGGGCVGEGEAAYEILVGAEDAPLEWLSPNLSANLGVKFTLLDQGRGLEPIGLGGFFDMTGGPLTFELFAIRDMNAAMAFGAKDGDPWAAENYLAASTDLQLGDWGMAGGVFFGRSCSLDPIALIDPAVADVLGNPPFTGAYLYGEARAPLNEVLGIPSTCMLTLTYGAGLGLFYFDEGPTFGGKWAGEISGEALCIFSISGRMELAGAKEGLPDSLDAGSLMSSLENNPMRFAGRGTLKGKVGACPFCAKFKKTARVKFKVDGGDIKAPSIGF